MSKTVQDILNMIAENDIQMVDFKMVDINGAYRHVSIPARNFSEETMRNGIGFDASNYGYAVVEKSDMVFIPDPDTAVIDPFCAIPTLSMTGNAMIIDYPENRPLAQYPRNIVRAAEDYMKQTGVADTMLILPEFEFFVDGFRFLLEFLGMRQVFAFSRCQLVKLHLIECILSRQVSIATLLGVIE